VNRINNEISFKRQAEEKYTDSEICFPKLMYFDFETGCECELNDFTNENMRAYLKSFMKRFDMNITNAFIKNRKYRISHRENGIMTADSYGTAIKRAFEFANYCDKSKGDVFVIENTDCFCAEESYSAFADFLISVIFETRTQAFVTARSRAFAKLMKEKIMGDYATYIDIYKDEDKIFIKTKG